jgi:hypothetical protein
VLSSLWERRMNYPPPPTAVPATGNQLVSTCRYHYRDSANFTIGFACRLSPVPCPGATRCCTVLLCYTYCAPMRQEVRSGPSAFLASSCCTYA